MSEKNEISEEMPFEEALKRLEAVVREMESGQLPLEESLSRFEEGNRLAAFCDKRLTETEKRIEVLVKSSEQVKWQEMEAGADAGS